jgi:opacity protein-like surface antigen
MLIGGKMIKYNIAILAALLAVSNSTAKDFYTSISAGVIKSNKVKSDAKFYERSGNKKLGYNSEYSVGLGYKVNGNLRADVSYNFSTLKYSGQSYKSDFNQKIKLKTGMLNLYYDFFGDKVLTPYLGVGLGFSQIKPGDAVINNANGAITSFSKRANNLSYSIASGISAKVNEKVNLDIGYKYQDHGKANGFYSYETSTGFEKDLNTKKYKIKTHSAIVGVRFNF